MSDLRPAGVPVEIFGKQRRLLFTLNAIDEIESAAEKPIMKIFDDLTKDESLPRTLRSILTVLLNDEAERERDRNPESDLEILTEKQVGWVINTLNMTILTGKVLAAYGISVPELGEDDDPNRGSGLND